MAIGSNYYQYGTVGPIQDLIIVGFTVYLTLKTEIERNFNVYY